MSGLKEKSRRAASTIWPHIVFVIVVAAIAEIISGRLVSKLIVPKPSDVLVAAEGWITTGYLLRHLLATLHALSIGFVIGALVALVLAIILTELPRLGRFAEPYIIALSVIPAIALVPLFVVWLGLGIETKIVMGAFGTFFTVFITAYDGFKNADAKLLELAQLLKASHWQRLVKFRLWLAAPFFFSGAKLALPKAALAIVATEYLAGNRGLGYAILKAGNVLDIGGLFVGVIALTLLILVLSWLLLALERVTLSWVPKERKAS